MTHWMRVSGRVFTGLCVIALLLASLNTRPAQAQAVTEDQTAAVVYAYFRISDVADDTGSTLSVDQFKNQITEIQSGAYHVLSLADITNALSQDQPLNYPSIGLTFDGADPSLFETALPILKEADLPFTVFITPSRLDEAEKQPDSNAPDWDDIRALHKNKNVTIGITPYNYNRMTRWTEERIQTEVNRAKSRYREELGQEAEYFAYPYGLYSKRVRTIVEKSGFKAAFGQQSGLVHRSADRLALPRFTMTDDFGDLERFRLTSHALPLPVTDVEPKDSIAQTATPLIGFTVSPQIPAQDVKKIVCFGSGIGKLNTEVLGRNRVEIRFPQNFEEGRGRINCTLPTNAKGDQDIESWRWLGFLLAAPVDPTNNMGARVGAALDETSPEAGPNMAGDADQGGIE